MGIDSRIRSELQGPGPYIAKITNLLDPMFMGSMEVVIEKGFVADSRMQTQTYVVKYLSPFYGVTGVQYEGSNPADFNDVQKSYGMWMIPPDIGTRVMVIFIDGDPNQGYWLGCIPDTFQNHMIPGIAATTTIDMSPADEMKYGTKKLPSGEFLKGAAKDFINPESQKKPIHPFADRLLQQGLLLDNIRGTTSSSARREVPSMVFGISTPGPLDPNGKTGLVGYTNQATVPVSRLGGTQFVMDDGDQTGQNELVRLRTRTGHQILMHNSSDLIYIANSKGTAWIELTSNGKIDIYAEDSVSIHTEEDFNFRADRDINFEAGRNFNLKVGEDANINVDKNHTLIVGQNNKLQIQGTSDSVIHDSYKLTANADYHLKVGTTIFETAGQDFNILSGLNTNITSAATTNVLSGVSHVETAPVIHMNGPSAHAASASANAATSTPLQLFNLPNRNYSAGWENGQFYKDTPIVSIMQRVPTHEPWDQHENIDSEAFGSDRTDSAVGATAAARPTVDSNGKVVPPKVPTANAPLPPPNGKQPADWSKDDEFIKKVKAVANSLGCDYIDLLSCMAFETGRTFNPALRNSIGATGLIQFINPTAKSLGTTTDYLASLTRTQQMDWVEKYFKAGPVNKLSSPSLEDLYMGILWPAAVGKPNDTTIFKAGTREYSQNAGLDISKDGNITKAECASKVRDQRDYVRQQLANAGYTV